MGGAELVLFASLRPFDIHQAVRVLGVSDDNHRPCAIVVDLCNRVHAITGHMILHQVLTLLPASHYASNGLCQLPPAADMPPHRVMTGSCHNRHLSITASAAR